MRHALLLHAGAEPAREHVLLRPCTAGGSATDEVHLPGLPPRALALSPCAAGVVVEVAVAGAHVAGHPVPPGGRRLLRPGERAELLGAALALPPGEAGATRVAAAALVQAAAEGEPEPAGPHLVVLTGPAAGERVPLRGEQTLGRGRRADVRLEDAQASRVHARVRVGAGCAAVEDLGSKNGVRLNGVRLDRRPCPLRNGDLVRLGETELAFVAGEPAAAAPARAARAAHAERVEPRAAPAGPGAGAGSPHRRPRRAPHVAAAALLALSAAALALAAT